MGEKTKPKELQNLLKMKQPEQVVHSLTQAPKHAKQMPRHATMPAMQVAATIMKYHSSKSTVPNLSSFAQDLWCSVVLNSYSCCYQAWGPPH